MTVFLKGKRRPHGGDVEVEYSPGGSKVVACLLACDAGINIHPTGQHLIVWDAIYDNAYDFNPLDAIPDGLGLAFTFDGSSSTIETIEKGIWSFSYSINRNSDDTWVGQLMSSTLGRHFQLVSSVPSGGVNDTKTDILELPSGAEFDPILDVQATSTVDPYVASIYLSIVRIK